MNKISINTACDRLYVKITASYCSRRYDSSHVTKTLTETADQLKTMLENNHDAAVLQLAETAMAAVSKVIPKIFITTELKESYKIITEIHLKACRAVKLDPIRLAQKLLHLQLFGWGDIHYDNIIEYADILTDEGLRYTAQVATKGWIMLNSLQNNDNDPDTRTYRSLLLRMAITAAEMLKELEYDDSLFVGRIERPIDYYEIGYEYENQGYYVKALKWAENGIRAFPTEKQWLLCRLAACACVKYEDREKAYAIIYLHFCSFPCMEGYIMLKEFTEEDGTWPTWQKMAIEIW